MTLKQPRTPSLDPQTTRPIPRKQPFCSVMMLSDNNDSQINKRTTSLQIRSAIKTQVFENLSERIVCYRNESGEMICEGYDEGPRFQTITPVSTSHSRDVEIIDLLQKNWVQLGDGGCSLYKSKGGAVLLQRRNIIN